MTSSLGIFSKKNKFRQIVYKIVVNPEYNFPDEIFKPVQLEELDSARQKELLNAGFKKDVQMLHRVSDFETIKWSSIEGNNLGNAQALKNQRILKAKKYQSAFIALHQAFNTLVSFVILANIMLILMTDPTNDPTSDNYMLLKKLDKTCTVFYIFEALLRVIAMGFAYSSIPD